MLCRARKSLVNAFEPSSWAAPLVGPKQRRFCFMKWFTRPSTSGASGPTMVRSMPSRLASSASASLSITSSGTLVTFASRAVPALPGATNTFSTSGDCAAFQARACSRPPEPMIRTFMLWFSATGYSGQPSMTEVAHTGKHHRHAVLVGGGDHFLVADRAARLDHAGDAVGGGVVDTVAEREEGVGGHHGILHFQARMLGLDGRDACGIDAAHLAGTDANGLAVFRIDDGVRLDELGHFPGEDQVVHFCFGRD